MVVENEVAVKRDVKIDVYNNEYIIYDKNRMIDNCYEYTRIKMNLLPIGVINIQSLNNKAFLVSNKCLQELIFAIRALTDVYHKDIPGSDRLSDGSSLSVVDSETKNLYACFCYVTRQLYPLVQRNKKFHKSLMCHFECVLDLFDGRADMMN